MSELKLGKVLGQNYEHLGKPNSTFAHFLFLQLALSSTNTVVFDTFPSSSVQERIKLIFEKNSVTCPNMNKMFI